MKKVILTSAALMAFAAASYAQVINQVGQNQFASQNQFGVNQVGTINQIQALGDPNRTNYGNYAITYQGTPVNTGANTLQIDQNGGSQGNRAGIGQTGGPANLATISQSGGNLGLSGGATSVSATAGAAGEDGNFAGIAQTGALNTASINEDNNSRRNSAETYQNGTSNIAITRQSNNSIANTAYIFQGYSGMNAVVTPVSSATAEINQGKLTAGSISLGQATPEAVGNTASITQTVGNVNTLIVQGSDIAGLAGRASGATATVKQSAVQAFAVVLQGTVSGEAVGSKANITQSAAQNGATIVQGAGSDGGLPAFVTGSDYNSTATITQSAIGGLLPNFGFISQGVGGATDTDQATITQSGGANSYAFINQGVGFGTYSNEDKATITQSGTGSTATINQGFGDFAGGETNGRLNTATVTQSAGVTNGIVLIDQGFTPAAGAVLQVNRNTATVTQTAGTGIRAHIAQGRLGTPLDAISAPISALVIALNGVPVVMNGTIANDNTATITQTAGDGHNANIYQTGRFNTAGILQNGGQGAQALIVQTSNSQRASAQINQTSAGTNNVATIYQFSGSNADNRGAFGNIATIDQIAGSNNVAVIQQGGQGFASSANDNEAHVTQNGSSNTTRFLQAGDNNVVNITQNGNGGLVTGISVDFASQTGYNNHLTLTQNSGNGPGLVYKYTQVGNNNTQVVVQNN